MCRISCCENNFAVKILGYVVSQMSDGEDLDVREQTPKDPVAALIFLGTWFDPFWRRDARGVVRALQIAELDTGDLERIRINLARILS